MFLLLISVLLAGPVQDPDSVKIQQHVKKPPVKPIAKLPAHDPTFCQDRMGNKYKAGDPQFERCLGEIKNYEYQQGPLDQKTSVGVEIATPKKD